VVDQARIRDLAVPLLIAACNGGANRAAIFRPRDEDYPLVFKDHLEPRTAHFQALWAMEVEITAPPQNTEIIVTSARADELPTATWFPRGYHTLAGLVPDRIWLAWKYVEPGERLGMAYDGLVWLDERFVWFPKPWRVVQGISHPLYVE
jgi:hypothetical protein